MSTHHDREWEERLETGAENDELLALAAQLRRAGETTRATPSLAFQRQLRRDLLSRYPVAPQRGVNVWRWVGSLAAVALLAAASGLMWLSISSSGRASFGGTANGEAETALVPLPEGAIYLETHGYTTLEARAPGETLSLNGRWHIPANVANGADLTAFLQLRDEAGALVAQADGPLTSDYIETRNGGEAWWFLLSLALPEDLLPGEYLLVTGLVGANGQRLPVFDQVVGDEIVIGPVTIGRTADADPKVTVLDVSPAAGAVFTGTQPITFTVRLAYEAVSPPALLEVKIAETVGENGRGVATAQVTLETESGEVTVPVVLRPAQELNAPAELGLWLQLRADADSPPELIAMPDVYRWRYTP